LQVTPPDEVPIEDAIDRISSFVEELRVKGELPGGLDISLGGSAGKLVTAQKQFGTILLIALIISYLLLAGLFEDWVSPIVVLVSVPLAAGGGVALLRIVDATLGAQPLDIMTALGFLILIGVVVNNAILIVDGALARLRDGTALDDAVSEAVTRRVRPIFMSTLTSLAGLAPMVVLSGAGSELYRGVGSVVLGGMALSTFLSLFVVPSLFSLLWRLRRSSRA
jgi:HAE1 family hydrophobic/amphiphilic exporter-1